MASSLLTLRYAAARAGAHPAVVRLNAARERVGRDVPEWPTRLLFVAGLPKSGTTWLEQLLGEVPGYHRRSFRDPDRCTARHDLCDRIFESIEPYKYSVLKLHTRATKENLEVLSRHGVRTVVMHRDLRDQCVSRYFHVLKDPDHRHHELYEHSSKEDALAHSVEVTIEHSRPWVEDWLAVIDAKPDGFHEVRYEDLRSDPRQVLEGVLAFYGIDPQGAGAGSIVEQVAASTRFELTTQSLTRNRSTAREGSVGGWRLHLTPAMAERFRQECGDLFARLGQPL